MNKQLLRYKLRSAKLNLELTEIYLLASISKEAIRYMLNELKNHSNV